MQNAVKLATKKSYRNDILALIEREPGKHTNSTISQHFTISGKSTSGYINTLLRCGLISKSPKSATYSPSNSSKKPTAFLVEDVLNQAIDSLKPGEAKSARELATLLGLGYEAVNTALSLGLAQGRVTRRRESGRKDRAIYVYSLPVNISESESKPISTALQPNRHKGVKSKVLSLFEEQNDWTIPEVQEKLNISYYSAYTALEGLKRQKLVRRTRSTVLRRKKSKRVNVYSLNTQAPRTPTSSAPKSPELPESLEITLPSNSNRTQTTSNISDGLVNKLMEMYSTDVPEYVKLGTTEIKSAFLLGLLVGRSGA